MGLQWVFMLQRIDRILLRVPALESAVRYYRDVLGLKLLRQDSRLASFQLAQEGTELVLHADADLPAEAIYYRVDDVRQLYREREKFKLQFIQSPAPAARGWRATVKDPFGNILLLIDQTTAAAGEQAVEDARPADALFAGVESKIAAKPRELIAAYEQLGRTADDLPYTPHFESLYSGYCSCFDQTPPSRQEAWRHLLNLRKAGKLPKLGEARSKPPAISSEDRQHLRQMLGADIGKRDRLPYSERFGQLVDEFNQTQRRPLSPHLVWRLVATLAK